MSLDIESQLSEDAVPYYLEAIRLSAIIFSIVKHLGEDFNLILKDAAEDGLPDRIMIGYNTLGDDVLITILQDDQIEE